jgi:NADPH-dependent 2,4-dienoyl-CoA reductase/sulfur reductase-like enzyme
MKQIKTDLAIIGGGPAGLAAALEAKVLGIKDVLVIERDYRLGGILNQCIHDGFGIVKFNKRLTGGQYAQFYVDKVQEAGIRSLVDTMALELTPDKKIYAVNSNDGMLEISASAVVLAMGCRERSRPQTHILGTRPAGVYTAGVVQRLINVEGCLPGKRAVILGSGDIGLIMARRMTLEGIEVEGVYEIMSSPGGLTRNVEQCLRDYDIPLHLSTTVTRIEGANRVEGIVAAQADDNLKPVKGTERFIPCDLVVLSVGLIPENELSAGAGIELHPLTRGPVVDQYMETSIPGIFAAGNVAGVFDLVDYVSETGELAARGALAYIAGKVSERNYVSIKAGTNMGITLPQRINVKAEWENTSVFMRAREIHYNVVIYAEAGGLRTILGHERAVRPAEMVVTRIKPEALPENAKELTIHLEAEKQ